MDIKCPVCKQDNIKKSGPVISIYANELYWLGRCLSCAHLFTLDHPGKDGLERIYGTVYNYSSHRAIRGEKQWRFRWLKGSIGNFLPRDIRILDVGCGCGDNLNVLNACGYRNLYGIDINDSAVDVCRKNGLDVFKGRFDQWLGSGINTAENKPDCVILSHILEHIDDLDDFFKGINNLLERGSRLIILVPNAGSATARIFNKYWGWWQTPLHLQHFSRASVLELLRRQGFKSDLVFTRGADSLFFLSSLLSIFRLKSGSRILSGLELFFIRVSSAILRYWLFLGDEELVVIASKL